MPSRYSSEHSIEDAQALAANLGIDLRTISIREIHETFERQLASAFEGRPSDITEENIQARVRGTILMALSNKFGRLVLSTGNKSELSCGYCTLYGDMAGGLAVILDVPKMLVYELAHYLNRNGVIIPPRSISKAPTAELRFDQKDQDSLPPYDLLDQVLEAYIVQAKSKEEIIAQGFSRKLVERVLKMIYTNEYKRQQAALGLKVTPKAFGKGRRYPIAQHFRG